MEESKKDKRIFLLRWMGVNLLGWTMGVFAGGYMFLRFSSFSIFDHFLTSDITFPLSIYLPFGALLGTAQSLLLTKLKIRRVFWVIATSFAWGISITVISWYYDNVYPERLKYGNPIELIYYVVAVLLVGALIGLSQAWVAGKSFPTKIPWIASNAISLLGSAILYFIINLLAALLLSPLDPGTGGYTIFDQYMEIVFVFSIPIAGVVSSFTTGKLLWQYRLSH